MNVIKPPQPLPISFTEPVLFLGGSIEMGAATMWQDRIIDALSTENRLTILNPRRDDWDASWIQDPTEGTPFREQVEWELKGQDAADIIIYYFDSNTKSPITLLELGLYADTDKDIFVYCEKDFWRYGNVKIVCDKYFIKVYNNEHSLVRRIKGLLV